MKSFPKAVSCVGRKFLKGGEQTPPLAQKERAKKNLGGGPRVAQAAERKNPKGPGSKYITGFVVE